MAQHAEELARVNDLLGGLENYGPEAAEALHFLKQHRTRVGIHDQPTGARWTLDRRIELHPRYEGAGGADELHAISLIIHEVRHLQQGALTALSVYGELDAWQLQFGFLKRVRGHYHAAPRQAAILEELMSQPLSWDRSVLQHVRELMKAYAGKAYRIDLLPLYPLPREIAFGLTGREPQVDRTN